MSAVFSFNRSNATHNRKRTSIEFIQTSCKQVLITCKRKNVVNALLRILKERRSWVTCGVVGSGHEIDCEQPPTLRTADAFPVAASLSPQKSYFRREDFSAVRRLSLTFLCKVTARETVDQARWRSHRTCRILREKADCKQSSDERDGMERRKIVIFAVIYYLILIRGHFSIFHEFELQVKCIAFRLGFVPLDTQRSEAVNNYRV